MGTFNTGGVAAEMAKFDRLRKGADKALEKAVEAGGKVLAECIGAAAPLRTGRLQRSVKAGKVQWSAADGFHCDVMPMGKNPRGEPYAKIGNILEYGHGNVPPRPWFNPAVARAEEEVVQVMRDTFEEASKG